MTQEFDSVMEQVVKFMIEGKTTSSVSSPNGGASNFWSNPSSKSAVVGVDEDLLQWKDRLTGMQTKLEIVPIVGMGGAGKTTLARNLYEDPLIVEHFDVRAWTAISQNYDTNAILLGLLHCIIGKEFDKDIGKVSDELEDTMYRSLYGRRYMIVLDDIWSTKFWDEKGRYFPDNNNGSRIVITTRESHVAKYAYSQSQQRQVQLLSDSDSWDLLHQIVFGEDDCPNDLQGIGEKIASDCGGPPLAINVIGGLLSKVERAKDVWEKIRNDVRAAIAESNEQFSNILSLSYNHLPNHLKSCFLYVGAFPEDYGIKGSRLVRMWVAEGFVKSKGYNNSLEEEAEDYLKALVERNLVLVEEEKHINGKPKSYSMHDLLRDLCMRKADEDKFLHVVKNGPKEVITFSNLRRVSVHTSDGMEDVYVSTESAASLARSYIGIGLTHDELLSPAVFALRLLRVLDAMEMNFQVFPREILQLVNLRYLAISCGSTIPSGISRLWNLKTLIAKFKPAPVPCEMWEMSELRHLKLNEVIWFDDEESVIKCVQKKLQTLVCMWLAYELIERGFFESIPNIKTLGIYYGELSSGAVVDLSFLHKLEILRCMSNLKEDGRSFLATVRFPCSLRKLTLIKCVLFPTALTTLCALPNLEVLILDSCAFARNKEKDEEWETSDDQVWEAREGDEFRSLQFLHLETLNLVRWVADETNFPTLRQLHIDYCYSLQQIPCGIGEIPTLQSIELYKCSPSVVASAKQIVEVQQSDYDNYALQLRIC